MEIEVTAMGVAIAIRSGHFGTKEHDSAMSYVLDHAESSDDAKEGLHRIGNVSAIRQTLEKAGLLKSNGTDSAFIAHVRKAVAILDNEVATTKAKK